MDTNHSNFNSWLRFNELNEAQVKQFCESNEILKSSISLADEKNKINFCEKQAWSVCAQAQLIALPTQLKAIQQVRDLTQTHFSDKISSENSLDQQAYTLDQGRNKPAKVSCPYHQTAEDLMLMMHEFSHAVQLLLSYDNNINNLLMPPVARECCAFIGELALLEFTSQNNPSLHHQLKSVWDANNQLYLGDDLAVLSQRKTAQIDKYNYRWNYPIARKAASVLWAMRSLDQINSLFCSAEQGMSYLPIDDLFINSVAIMQLPTANRIKPEFKVIRDYQRLGIAVVLDCYAMNEKSKMSLMDYEKGIKKSIKKSTLFIHFNKNKNPVAYAQVNSRDPKKKIIKITHQCALNGRYIDLLSALKHQYDDKQLCMSDVKHSARSEQLSW